MNIPFTVPESTLKPWKTRLVANMMLCNLTDVVPRVTTPFRLLDLPGELRNQIYEFVLFHSENNGCIAPVLIHSQEHLARQGDRCCVIVNGKRKRTQRIAIVRAMQELLDDEVPELSTLSAETRSSDGIGEDRIVEIVDPKNGLAPYVHEVYHHLCSLDCLMQPTITMVNRQIRSETLPLFYGMHDFHLEPDGGKSGGSECCYCKVQGSLCVLVKAKRRFFDQDIVDDGGDKMACMPKLEVTAFFRNLWQHWRLR